MPASFNFPPTSEIWTNLRLTPPTRRGPFPYIGLGRLKPGATMEQAQRETNAIGHDIERRWIYYQHLSLPILPSMTTWWATSNPHCSRCWARRCWS